MELYKARVTLEVLVDGVDHDDAKSRIHEDLRYLTRNEDEWSTGTAITDHVVDYPERIER